MLAIRLQRVGRKGNAQYRIIVQEAQKHPTSGRIVAFAGTYDPHTKDAKVQVEVAQRFLDNGAQPSPRVVKLLTDAGVKMPDWVTKRRVATRSTKNTGKLRKNQPVVEQPAEEIAAEVVNVEETVDSPVAEEKISEIVAETDAK